MSAPTYPLTPPTSPAYTTSRWALQRRTAMSQSPFTGNQQVAEFSSALWTVDLNLPPMRRATVANWQAFLLQLHGKRGTFLLGDPDAKTPRGAVNATVTVASAGAIGDFTLALNTASQASTTGIVKTGDYIQLGAGSAAKLYMICADANSDSSGNFSVTIEPSLKAAAGSGATATFTNTVGVFRLVDDNVAWDANQVSTYGVSLSRMEAF